MHQEIGSLNKKALEEVKESHCFEYLVMYVHFIDRLVKRLASKGKVTYVDAQQI